MRFSPASAARLVPVLSTLARRTLRIRIVPPRRGAAALNAMREAIRVHIKAQAR